MQLKKTLQYFCLAVFGAFLLSESQAQESFYTVGTISQMVALNPTRYPTVFVRGRITEDDGGGGIFHNTASYFPTNAGTVFMGTGSYSTRRWVREYSGPAQAEWWGFDGTTKDQARFVDALAAVDTLHFSVGTYRVSANLDVSPNEKLIFDRGALLSIDSGKTLTVRGDISAGYYPIFTGAGNVSFGTFPKVPEIPVSWFGADPTFGSDSTPAFNKALASAVSALPVRVYVPAGQYRITSTVSVPSRLTLEGEGLSSSLYFVPTANDQFLLKFAANGDNAKIRSLSLVNYSPTGISGASGICAGDANGSVTEVWLENLYFDSFERYGIYMEEMPYPKMNKIRVMRTHSKTTSYQGAGLYFKTYVSGLAMRECRINNCDYAIYANGEITGGSIEATFFETNGDTALNPHDTIYIGSSHGLSISGCYFEGNFTGAGALDSVLHLNNSLGVAVSGSTFFGDYGLTTNSMNFVYVTGASKGVVFTGNNFGNPIANYILVDGAANVVGAYKNAYTVGKSNTPITRYEDITAHMTANAVDLDVPAAFTWTPGLVDIGQVTSVTVPVVGAKKGRRDQILAQFDNLGANNMVIDSFVQADGLVRVVLKNESGLLQNIGAGTLSVRLQKLD